MHEYLHKLIIFHNYIMKFNLKIIFKWKTKKYAHFICTIKKFHAEGTSRCFFHLFHFTCYEKATCLFDREDVWAPKGATLLQFFHVTLFGSTGIDFVLKVVTCCDGRYNFANAPVTKAATLHTNNKTEPVPNLETYIAKKFSVVDFRSRVWVVFRANTDITYMHTQNDQNTGAQRLNF